MRPTLLLVFALLCGCKGGNNYASMAKQANAARLDAGNSDIVPAPPGATLLGSGQNSPRLLQVEGDTLFWMNEGGRAVGAPGLFKVPKAGGPTVALMQEPDLMAMAADASAVYWLAPRVGKVGKVPRGGGAPEVLAETTGIVRGMAIDDTDVFWAENEAIYRVSKAGGKVATVVTAAVPDFLNVDGTHVYYYSTITGVILRAPKKGGAAVKVHSDDQHTFHTFFIDGPDLFVSFGAEKKMEIQRLPKTGGKPVTVVDGQDPASDFAIDGANIYWITEDDIFKVPRNGGASTKVAQKLEHGRDLAVDDRFLYLSDRSGRVEKLPK